MSKRFTLAEAEKLLPRIGRLIREAVSLKTEYDESEAALQKFSQKVMLMGGIIVDRDRVREARIHREGIAERLKAALESIQETGCIVKDLDIGLVDFPTLFRGDEVYLCWKMGEPAIEFWHGIHEGFAGRKAIDRDFRENHRGDPHN